MTLPERLAQKWCPAHGEETVVEGNHLPICSCKATAAAIQEALEAAAQVAFAVGTQAAATDQGPRLPTPATCGAVVAAVEIADRLRALRETR